MISIGNTTSLMPKHGENYISTNILIFFFPLHFTVMDVVPEAEVLAYSVQCHKDIVVSIYNENREFSGYFNLFGHGNFWL